MSCEKIVFFLCHIVIFYCPSLFDEHGWILALFILSMFMDLECIEVCQRTQKELGASQLTTELLAFEICGYGTIILRKCSRVFQVFLIVCLDVL